MITGFGSKLISFTPGFSPVPDAKQAENRFNGLPSFALETVKTILNDVSAFPPG